LLIAFPNADDPPSGNHESLESKIPKRKKARPNTRLSCKIEYFIETTSAYLSGRSAFFTDDYVDFALGLGVFALGLGAWDGSGAAPSPTSGPFRPE
jgi:hypothetical protein